MVYVLLAGGVIGLGLASRQYGASLPFVYNYVGDTLWALMIFLGIGFLFPRWSTKTVALVAWLVCVGVELSQLYHAPWIDELRATRLGGLVLGFSFLWSDLLYYLAGVLVGVLVEYVGMPLLREVMADKLN